MHLQKLLPLVAILPNVWATTPDGFTPAASADLGVSFPDFDVTVTPNLLVPRPRKVSSAPGPAPNLSCIETISAPTIKAPTATSNSSSYILFMIDLDVLRNNTRVTLLHWLQPDLVVGSAGTLVAAAGNASGSGAAYLQPSPPVGDIPHRYTEILFAQPAGFSIPAAFASVNPPASVVQRIGFSLPDFVSAAGLGAPLAGNYFRVQNLTGVASGTGTGTPTATSSSKPTFTGAGVLGGEVGPGTLVGALAGVGVALLGVLI
ncbi:hypothetical protein BP6252_10048 [Coleophoma cylindrospora]|uniref:PEBP-like protein n=1 Tax=Coleophoma cylindrospora TaxID=1849047 RepID=A0A3D8QX55_9HELO|nr:hypothetical protein BP6252_10048 [Coleophoma cylindrospora]